MADSACQCTTKHPHTLYQRTKSSLHQQCSLATSWLSKSPEITQSVNPEDELRTCMAERRKTAAALHNYARQIQKQHQAAVTAIRSGSTISDLAPHITHDACTSKTREQCKIDSTRTESDECSACDPSKWLAVSFPESLGERPPPHTSAMTESVPVKHQTEFKGKATTHVCRTNEICHTSAYIRSAKEMLGEFAPRSRTSSDPGRLEQTEASLGVHAHTSSGWRRWASWT